MLPGFTRTAAQPASIAANTYFGWKWMSAITGICDLAAMAGSASASSWLGQATRTMSQPAAVSSAICCSVALTSAVSVVVIDCTEIGCSEPTPTVADLQLPGLPALGQGRGRWDGHAQGDAHDLQYPHDDGPGPLPVSGSTPPRSRRPSDKARLMDVTIAQGFAESYSDACDQKTNSVLRNFRIARAGRAWTDPPSSRSWRPRPGGSAGCTRCSPPSSRRPRPRRGACWPRRRAGSSAPAGSATSPCTAGRSG